MKKSIICSILCVSFAFSFNSFNDLKQFAQKYAEKKATSELQSETSKFGMKIDVNDMKNIEATTQKALNEQVNEYLQSVWNSINMPGVDLSISDIKEIDVKNILNNKIESSVQNSFSQGLGVGGVGMCCCSGWIDNKVDEVSQYIQPAVQQEAILLGQANEIMKKASENEKKERLGDYQWNKGTMGDFSKAEIALLPKLNQTIFALKKITALIELEVKESLSIAKSILEEQKIQMFKKKDK